MTEPQHETPHQPTPPHDHRGAAPLPSEAVLRGQNAVEIEHNGQIYRLQTTRQGKLILTK